MTKKYHRSTNKEDAHRENVNRGRKAWTDGTLGGWLGKKKSKQA